MLLFLELVICWLFFFLNEMQVAAKVVHYGYKMLQFDFYPKNQIKFRSNQQVLRFQTNTISCHTYGRQKDFFQRRGVREVSKIFLGGGQKW